MDTSPSALLTDLYQLNMVQAYLEAGQTETAVFEFLNASRPARTIPSTWRPGSTNWQLPST